jgi:hypothetical protein
MRERRLLNQGPKSWFQIGVTNRGPYILAVHIEGPFWGSIFGVHIVGPYYGSKIGVHIEGRVWGVNISIGGYHNLVLKSL